MAETLTGYLELGDGKLYYEVAGESNTLVLGHAGFLDSGMWDPQWDAFAERHLHNIYSEGVSQLRQAR